MIDCGNDWLGRVARIHPDAILPTHAHPDHAGGLKRGSPCPVFATAETWRIVKSYPIAEPRVILPHRKIAIGGLEFEAFPVEHSLRAPAVGYRVGVDGVRLIYLPDVAAITEPSYAFAGIDLYIGDGATITRPLLRQGANGLIGHASITTQLKWCQQERVRRAIFTHCGSQIVAGDERRAASRVRELGQAHGVEAWIAHDGLD